MPTLALAATLAAAITIVSGPAAHAQNQLGGVSADAAVGAQDYTPRIKLPSSRHRSKYIYALRVRSEGQRPPPAGPLPSQVHSYELSLPSSYWRSDDILDCLKHRR